MLVLLSAAVAQAAEINQAAPQRVIIRDRTSGWQVKHTPSTDQSMLSNSEKGRIAWKHSVLKDNAGNLQIITDLQNNSDKRSCIAVEYQFKFDGAGFSPYFAGATATPD
jgi:hypothetical protein